MRSNRSASPVLALSALATFASAACGDAPAGVDATGTTSEAVVMSDTFTLSPTIFNAIEKTLQLSQITVAIANGKVTATPSPAMTNLLGISALSASVPTSMSFTVFSLPVIGNVNATANVSSFSVDPGSVAIALNGNGVAASATWSASIDVSMPSPLPNPSVSLHGTVSTQIVRANTSSSDRLQASALTIGVTSSSSSCGAFNWCGGLVEGVVQNEESSQTASLASALKSFMNAQLATAAVTQKIDAALGYLSNGTLNPHTGGTAWGVYAGSLAFSGYGATWNATHWIAPAPLTGCDATEECDGTIAAYCRSNMTPGTPGNDSQELQRQNGDGSWSTVGTVNYDDDPSPPVNATVTYRICAWNPAGSTCSGALGVATFPATGCSQGGAAGGGGGLHGGDPCNGPCKEQ